VKWGLFSVEKHTEKAPACVSADRAVSMMFSHLYGAHVPFGTKKSRSHRVPGIDCASGAVDNLPVCGRDGPGRMLDMFRTSKYLTLSPTNDHNVAALEGLRC
jgi:hypothetical protein